MLKRIIVVTLICLAAGTAGAVSIGEVPHKAECLENANGVIDGASMIQFVVIKNGERIVLI